MPSDLKNNLKSEDDNSSLEKELKPLKERLLEEQKPRPWKSDARIRVANSTEEDALPWTEDIDSTSSAKKAKRVKFAESLDPADVVKLSLSSKEWSAEESTWDGESPGWDINLTEGESKDNTNGEPPEEFGKSLEEEELSKRDSKEEELWWEIEYSDVKEKSEEDEWCEEDLSWEEELSEEDWWWEDEEKEWSSLEEEEPKKEEGSC